MVRRDWFVPRVRVLTEKEITADKLENIDSRVMIPSKCVNYFVYKMEHSVYDGNA